MPAQEPFDGSYERRMSIILLICRVHQRHLKLIQQIDDAAITSEGRKMCVLRYADDLVLIANKGEDDLQKSFNSLLCILCTQVTNC